MVGKLELRFDSLLYLRFSFLHTRVKIMNTENESNDGRKGMDSHLCLNSSGVKSEKGVIP